MSANRLTEQALPTGTTAADDLARMLARLCGPAFQAGDDSTNAADFVTLGRELDATRTVLANCIRNAFPSETSELLLEWEGTLRVPTDKSLGDSGRRTVLLARWRARRSGSPTAIEDALSVLDAGADVREYSAAECASTLPRCVFRFGVRVPSYYGTAKIGRITALLDAMKPAHTDYSLTSRPLTGFLCDDANSVCDDTLIGV